MDVTLQLLPKPEASTPLTAAEILTGPPVEPLDRVRLFDSGRFERFVCEWAYLCLQQQSVYARVRHLGGAGDLGRDIIALLDDVPAKGRFDIYQCKHYGSPLAPSEIWVELGKLCVFTFEGRFPAPRAYCFVSPCDVGPKLADLLDEPSKLKEGLIKVWKDKCERKISKSSHYPLSGDLRAHVDALDFSIFGYKPIHEIIHEFRSTYRYVGYFGGGLRPMPPDRLPPANVASVETRYVQQLLEAYSDEAQTRFNSVEDLAGSRYRGDLKRQRERFYCAETLRQFSRDSFASDDAHQSVCEEIFQGVVDCTLLNHPSGYQRLLSTMTAAAQVAITAHPLVQVLKPKSKQGICHQLANEERLHWVLDGSAQ